VKKDLEVALQSTDEINKINRYALIGAVLWSLLLSGLFAAYVVDNQQAINKIGQSVVRDIHVGGSETNIQVPIQEAMGSLIVQEACIHLFVWLIGLGLLWYGTRKIVRMIALLSNERNKLHESEVKFRTVADHTYEWEYWRSADGRLVYTSPSCERITGYSAEAFLQEPELLTRIIHPDDLDKFSHHLDVDTSGAAKTDCQTPDFRIFTRNGEECWISHICQEVFDSDGNSLGRRACNRDITERKQSEMERILLEQQFHQAQKLESLGLLAGGIAHDFNNILTVILGYSYLAKDDSLSDAEYKFSFKKVEDAANRAADLCRQMLTYAGKSPQIQTRVNLWLLVDEVAKMLQAAFKKNVTLKLDMKRDVPEITGDASQIQQIVMNLIINAADAIGDTNGTIRVALSKNVIDGDRSELDTFGKAIQPGTYACLEVTDSGHGMDEKTQKRVFEPFYTTKSTGRGLGMSAIRGIVTSHEATLHLTSTPGSGTTFMVCFPIPGHSDFMDATSITTQFPEKMNGTILLVDDEQELRNIGTSLLKNMGFAVLTASNGQEALEIFKECEVEIDVVMLDLIMPVMGGVETYNNLRTIKPTLPIIICSGYGAEAVEDVINNDTHACFVHKPYNPEQLRKAMDTFHGVSLV
jgi:PAS domain S-box-containing protein